LKSLNEFKKFLTYGETSVDLLKDLDRIQDSLMTKSTGSNDWELDIEFFYEEIISILEKL
jgi:hypothetical protein